MAKAANTTSHANLNAAIGKIVAGDGPTNFHVKINQNQVENYAREGNNLTIEFKDGRSMQLRGFFDNGAGYNNLVFEHGGQRWQANFDAALQLSGDGIVDPLVTYQQLQANAAEQGDSNATLLGILGGIAGLGALGGLAMAGGSSDGSKEELQQSATPTLLQVVNDSAAEVGLIHAGRATNDATPTFSGTAEPGALIKIYNNGVEIGQVVADANGNWSFTPESAWPDGIYNISFTAINSSGIESATTPTFELVIDTVAPSVTIGGLADDVEPVIGNVIDNGGVTNDNKPAIFGTSEPGAIISIYSNGELIGTTTAYENGAWTFIPNVALADGNHSFTVVATDAAGNSSAPTAGVEIVISTVAPAAITIAAVSEGNPPSISGEGALPGQPVNVHQNGQLIGSVIVDDEGFWSFTPDVELEDGTHNLTVTIVDAAGNESEHSDVVEHVINSYPTSLQIVDTRGTLTGPIVADGVTDDSQPTFMGTGVPGSTVTIYDFADIIGTALVDGDGNWSFTPETALADAAHQIAVSFTDADGNEGELLYETAFTVDTEAPEVLAIGKLVDGEGNQIFADSVTSDASPTLQGSGAEANSIINIYDNELLIGSTTTDAEGNWSFTIEPALEDDRHELTITNVDAAGNESQASAPLLVYVDTGVPPVIGIGQLIDSEDNEIAAGSATSVTSPILTGAGAESNSIIYIYDNGTMIGITTTDDKGNWSFAVKEPLEDGPHSLTISNVDAAGNESGQSAPIEITVDTAAPLAVEQVRLVDADGVEIAAGSTTAVTSPILEGSGAEANSIVRIYDNGTPIGETKADGNGNWSLAVPELGEDQHSLTVTNLDAAGNESAHSAPIEFNVDTIAPGAVEQVSLVDAGGAEIAAGSLTSLTTPTLEGTGAEANAIINIFDNGTLIGSTKADDAGNWSFTTPELSDEDHSLTVTVVDAAGNESAASAPIVITVDTIAPDAVVEVMLVDAAGEKIAAGSATSVTTPTLEGSGLEPGSTINIYDNGTLLGSVVVDGDGNWSFTTEDALDDGLHSLTVTNIDVAGNESAQSTAIEITVDTRAPAAIEQITLFDAAGAEIATGSSTAVTAPRLEGAGAEANSTILIYDNTIEIGSTITDAEGNWSFTVPELGADFHSLTVTVVDAAGNEGAHSAAIEITVDTIAPMPVEQVNLVDADGRDISSGSMTAVTTPTLQGTGAEANSIINIYDIGNLIGTAKADAEGNWSFTLPELDEDLHSLTVTNVDAAGNASAHSVPVEFIVDTTAPVAVEEFNLVDMDGLGIAVGSSIALNTPRLEGSDAEPKSTINIYDNNVLIGSATADANGNWSFTIKDALDDGLHSLTVTNVDAAGNEGAHSTSIDITIDTMAPVAVDQVRLLDADGVEIAAGSSTAITSPKLEGVAAESNSVVNIYDNGVLIGSTTADADGNWSFATLELGEDHHSLTVTNVDAAGNESAHSAPIDITVDTIAPVAVDAVKLVDKGGLEIAAGSFTTETTPNLEGTGAEAHSIINIYDDGNLIGTATADADGNWSFTVPQLGEGHHGLTATNIDAAGNESAHSAPVAIIVDTTAPNAVEQVRLVDADGAEIAAGSSTAVTTPKMEGSGAESNSIINIYDNGVQIGSAIANVDGNWSFTLPELGQDQHSLTVSNVDAAGNEGAPSAPIEINVDTIAPNALNEVKLVDAAGVEIAAGSTTAVTEPKLEGAGAEANSIINIYDGATLIGSATADADGNWSFTLPPLGENDHSLTVTNVDAAGNESVASVPIDITVDTIAPGAVLIGKLLDDAGDEIIANSSTAVTSPTLEGAGAEAKSIINVYDNGTLIGFTTADVDGNWSFTPEAPLADGPHSLTITNVDAAGNEGAASAALEIAVDTVAPAILAIGKLVDDQDGEIAANSATSVASPTLEGAGAEANSIINIYDNGTLIGFTTADVDGNWSFKLADALDDGPHSLTITNVDAAGNESQASAAFDITVDTGVPTVIAIDKALTAAAIEIAAGGSTSETKPTLQGAGAEENSTVNIYDNGVLIASVAADAAGNWSFTPEADLGEGDHSLTVTNVDAAGNESAASLPLIINVDTTVPNGVEIGGLTDGAGNDIPANSATSANKPNLEGTGAEPNSTINIYNGDVLIGSTVAGADGTWNFTPEVALEDGIYSLAISNVDAAGNESAQSDAIIITVDTQAPAIIEIDSVTDDQEPVLGLVTSGGIVNDNRPNLVGVGAEPGTTVNIYDKGDLIGSATVEGDGTWSFLPETDLADGDHSLTATNVDAAGNESEPSAPFDIMIDTKAPDAAIIESIIDDVTGQIGEITAMGGVTNDNRPTLSGSAEAGTTVTILSNGAVIGTALVGADHRWTFTPETDLDDGVHQLTVVVTDLAGNVSVASEPVSISVDTTAPAMPIITDVVDDIGEFVGTIASGGFTDDEQPLLSGTADAGVTVTIYDNGEAIGEVVADTEGKWSFTPAVPLIEGPHAITASASNAVGNVSATSDAWEFTIDLSVPVTDSLTTTFALSHDTADGVALLYGNNSSATDGDLVTRASSFTVSGILSAELKQGQIFQISHDGGQSWTTVLQDGGAAWTLAVNDEYPVDGSTTYSFRVTSQAGIVAQDSGFTDRTIIVDHVAPDGINLAPIVNGAVTTASVLSFSSADYGLAEAGSRVALVSDANGNGSYQEGADVILGYATVAADGSWEIETSLAEGAKNLAFVVFDKAGNFSGMGPSTSMTVANTAVSETQKLSWGGTTDAEGVGLNAAAVTYGENGLWSFAQSARGETGTLTANALRVYNMLGGDSYSSTYLEQPTGVSSDKFGRFVNSMVFADYNRDGHADIVSQVSGWGNSDQTAMWTNNGDGTYTPQALKEGAPSYLGGIVAFDMKGDGYLDFVIADSADGTVNSEKSITFIMNEGGVLTPANGNGKPDGIATNTVILHEVSGVDINNDGTIDIAAHTNLLLDASGQRVLSIFINKNGEFDSDSQQNYGGIFLANGTAQEGDATLSMTWADFNGDGWLDLVLPRGSSQDNHSKDSNETRIYLNDGTGKLLTSDNATIWLGDDTNAGAVLAVDWNNDGRMDIVEYPRNTSPGTPLLWLNNGDGTFAQHKLSDYLIGMTPGVLQGITGGTVVDYDWDGARDLILYREGGDSAVALEDNAEGALFIKNTNAPADGTSLHVRILDAQGINIFYGNTVKLYNSKGELVSTQIINPQSATSNDSSALVSFYGLDANETYSVQLLRITNGVSNNVGAESELGGFTNATLNSSWGNLKPGKANEAFILTAQANGTEVDTIASVIGTGYNDMFFASAGNDVYNGSGGWSSGLNAPSEWSATGGQDIVDYGSAASAIKADLKTGLVVGGSTGTDLLINMEGIYGTDFDDEFISGVGNHIFFGRGGDDIVDLSSEGSDTLLYKLLDMSDVTGGNGHDRVIGFTVGDTATNADADVVDLTELLTGYKGSVGVHRDADGNPTLNAASQGIREFLKAEIDGDDTVIMVDLDGAGTAFEMTAILTLQDVRTDLETLLANGNILV